MNGSTFNGAVTAGSMKTGASIFMKNATFKGDVDLHASDIGYNLLINNSSFLGTLDLSRVRVRGSMELGGEDPDTKTVKTNDFKKVIISLAEIQNDLNIIGFVVKDELSIIRTNVGNTLNISRADLRKAKDVQVTYSDLGRLYVNYAELPSLDLMGTTIHGSLMLGNITWNTGAKFTLRATRAKYLDVAATDWPGQLDIREFVYEGTYSSDLDNLDFAGRDSEWLKGWLAKQVSYSPQPYKQLAAVLRSSGYVEKSKEILFENRERERLLTTGVLDWLSLTIYRFLSGYGIYPLYYALIWTTIFVCVGCCLLYFIQNPFTKPSSTRWVSLVNQLLVIFIYSLDRFFPVVKLGEHIDPPIKPTGIVWYWFQVQQVAGFIVAIFLLAGLSGLVER